MTVIEMAQAIGLRVRETEEGKAYLAAKQEYESNIEINNALMEYQIQQDFLSKQEAEDGEPMSEKTLTRINDRINELYDFITNHEKYIQFSEAERKLNELLQNINRTVIAQITGETASDCTHDCSTCGGCH